MQIMREKYFYTHSSIFLVLFFKEDEYIFELEIYSHNISYNIMHKILCYLIFD